MAIAGVVLPLLKSSPEDESGNEGEEMPPIMQFLYFHKAIRAELAGLHVDALRITMEGGNAEIVALIDRHHFLRTIYEHHSSAEDEVILPALDLRVKNVALSYCLEHQVESRLFEQLLEVLKNALEANGGAGGGGGGGASKEQLSAIVSCTEALQTTLCQHLSKEEEQLFPLLVKNFSYEEQAALVWQFLCSIPVDLMEKFLPWLSSSLSLEDREKMITCMHTIVPSEELLQQVIFAWLKGAAATVENATPTVPVPIPQGSRLPINELLYWHNAIRMELTKLAEEARLVTSSSLTAFVERLQFLSEVCVFHCAAEDKVLFPAVDKKAKTKLSFSTEHAVLEVQQFELVQQLANEMLSVVEMPDSGADKLYAQAKLVMERIQQHFRDEEMQVIPLAQKHCSIEEQRVLLYQSLRVMPLKLLERVLPWLVELLSEEEAKDMLQNMILAAPVSDTHLVALFSGWACKGRSKNVPSSDGYRCIYSGGTQECPVQKMTKMPDDVTDMEDAHVSCTRSKRPRSWAETEGSGKNAIPRQCCVPGLGVKCSGAFARPSFRKPLSSPTTSSSGGSSLLDWGRDGSASGRNPIDHIFQFHRALRKDLEYLDLQSVHLGDCDEAFLRQFSGRFQFLWGLYKAHSNAEDDIVFPALEAKEALHNVSHSYSLDHKQEECLFKEIAELLTDLTQLLSRDGGGTSAKRWELAQRLQGMCKSIRCSLNQHVSKEEIELWPLFDQHFTIDEQDSIVGRIIGTTGAEVLQSMLPWVTVALTEEEQNVMVDSWKQATKNTMFDKWLRAWWEENSPKATSPPAGDGSSTPPSGTSESLQLVAEYLAKDSVQVAAVAAAAAAASPGEAPTVAEEPVRNPKPEASSCQGCCKKAEEEGADFECPGACCMAMATEPAEKDKFVQLEADSGKFKPGWQDIFRMNQKELEAAIRKVSSDSSLDPRRKAYLIQNLMTSRWIASQQHAPAESEAQPEGIPGRSRSYHKEGVYGCEHYQRNCKVRASCCGSLFTCRFCHDKASDHTMDRHATKEMMCMQCLEIQPVAERCSTPSCGGFKMASYFCSICNFFDNDASRDIYHCPFCNLCRRGKGLGIDYFHCMTCNACMNMSLKHHKCRENGLESNCPICHDFLFTSSSPVKALPCNHFMHSDCFQAYTCCHYTCPICSKSLGDMAVYFGMLDALLQAEQLPDEYKGRTQDILCNDCELKGVAPFHWLYHKCRHCGSYNTRTI